MNFSMYILATVIGSTAVAGVMAALAWRQRPEPGSTWLAVCMVAVAWWAGAYALVVTANDPSTRALWGWLQWIGVVSLPVAWVRFAFAYTARDQWFTRARFAGFLVVPASTLLLVWTNWKHQLLFTEVSTARFGDLVFYQVEYGPWFWVHLGYSYLLLVTGILVMLELAVSEHSLYRFQTGALVAGAFAPGIASIVSITGTFPIPGFDPLPITFLVTGLAGVGAVTRFGLFETVPSAQRIGRAAVVDRLNDAIVVLDAHDTIVDANPAADAVLETTPDEAVGRQATAVFPTAVNEALWPLDAQGSDLGTPTTFDAPGTGKRSRTIRFDGDDAEYYDLRESVLTDHHERVVGRTVALRDVTWRKRREDRLDVLNGILRQKLTDGADRDSEIDAVANDEVEGSVSSAVETGRKAEEIEELLDSDETMVPIDLVPMLQDELDHARSEFPFVTFDLDVELDDWGYCDGVIQPVVRNLLENAARHNTASEPTVTVRLSPDDESGMETIMVEDNGPGLTEDQRRILVDGSAADPQRSDGLGLWLVNWGVRQVGGEIEYEEGDPRGSVVTLRVPKRDESTDRDRKPRSVSILTD